jgi:hypothetical protein
VFFSDGSSKTLQKTFCKKIVSKSFNKKIDKQPKTRFRFFFYHVFGRFSAKGVQNTIKKIPKNKSDPGPILASDPPTHHGGHRGEIAGSLLLEAPCVLLAPCKHKHGRWAVAMAKNV